MTDVADADRDKWEDIYRRRGSAVGEPAAFLIESAAHLPRLGRALDLAGGAGRNALWLAGRGLDVTVADISTTALEAAQAAARSAGLSIATLELDLDAGPPPGTWDVILIFHFLDREILGSIGGALTAGGVFIFCHPTERNLERHGRPGRRFLLGEGEITSRLDPRLEVISLEEGWSVEDRHDVRLIARLAVGS